MIREFNKKFEQDKENDRDTSCGDWQEEHYPREECQEDRNWGRNGRRWRWWRVSLSSLIIDDEEGESEDEDEDGEGTNLQTTG